MSEREEEMRGGGGGKGEGKEWQEMHCINSDARLAGCWTTGGWPVGRDGSPFSSRTNNLEVACQNKSMLQTSG